MDDQTQLHVSLESVLRELGLTIEDASWREPWIDSEKSLAAHGEGFLRRDRVEGTCDWLGIRGDLREALRQSLAMVEQSEPLRRLAWYCHFLLFHAARRDDADPRHPWARLPQHIQAHQRVPLFHALVLLSGVPHVREMHHLRGIDESVTRDTLSDLELWIRHHHDTQGSWGFVNLGWICRHFTGRLYKLGRLQFCIDRFEHDFHAFRSRADGRVVLLAPNGKRFRADGQFDGTSGVFDAVGGWISVFESTGEMIRGNPITPKGAAMNRVVELRLPGWEEILKKHDPTLDVHIPATGPMTHADCGRSFRLAIDFFTRHFSGHKSRAFTCASWLMDDQLGDVLPAESNIVRFQREYYLHPYEGADDRQTFERAFDFKPKRESIDEYPQDSTLRRAIVRHVKAGGHWRFGSGLIFPDDLAWGEQVYRMRWREDL